MSTQPDHQAVRDAVRQWWDRRAHQATWQPDDGIETFLAAFDPDNRLPHLGGVFTPQENGNLQVTWAGRIFTVHPGESWTYRPKPAATGD